MSNSRISGLYRKTISERIDELERRGFLSSADGNALRGGELVLLPEEADKIIENVIGVFGLPLAIAPNFRVNGRDYLVPMVVEEPSIVAAVSDAARLARLGEGYTAECGESLLAGQIHLTALPDIDRAVAAVERARAEIIELADGVHPRLRQRGGGARDLEIRRLTLAGGDAAIAVNILVDTGDAMGANLVNTICERVAPRLAEVTGGEIALRILSNLTDRSLVRARVSYETARLETQVLDGRAVRDGIIRASEIAVADPYRAATHNKGIMNGIDALAIATGNDWRAIEAAAHAHAGMKDGYLPMTRWFADEQGALIGEIEVPLKPGIVGGTVGANPGAMLGLRIAGIQSARELAELMGAVGLAQNFAAIRALATTGIQQGHMRLHARSVASSAKIPEQLFDQVVDALVAEGDIKVWRAREILADLQPAGATESAPAGVAAGKVILLGEHAAVYGRHALAVPIVGAVRAHIDTRDGPLLLTIPEWRESHTVSDHGRDRVGEAVRLICKRLDIAASGVVIELRTSLPRGMGLGSSAALAVAIIRAFNSHLKLGLDDSAVNALAFECEKLAHGTPSGIDNAVATYAKPVLFRNSGSLGIETLNLTEAPPLVIACSRHSGLTHEMVRDVRQRRSRQAKRYDALFDEIDAMSRAGATALERRDYAGLGDLMNLCHGLLNAILVSTPELEAMVSIARKNGAVGAKLTGAGGGGSVVALCPDTVADVREAFAAMGYQTLTLEVQDGS